ncbi:hypothetical protein K7640_06105 [Micromonospora sp. PLK6-60]|uniref:hypothetical protein n=1 Tax=Micromonospora sp. PLK6-60 TaxID=2873383 RepID=UPI001CA61229|nr:hypothetical protein [Micromonospora sp. PLK6-60]MBY8871416.1 hypothetical protein [Micromonospora sp. PLK6-60]
MWAELYPEDGADAHDDHAAEMHRLRGLIVAQAAETETVLGRILARLDPGQNVARPAGQLLLSVRQRLDERRHSQWSTGLDLIYHAIRRRNEAVHRPVDVGYAAHDGDDTLVCDEEFDKQLLRRALATQQRSTYEAVRLLRSLDR